MLKSRVREAMEGAKLTAAELARATKVTNAAVGFWLDGQTKSLKGETAALMETATGYRAQWLVSGKGPKKVADQISNISPVSARKTVPLISWVQAGSWEEVQDEYQPGEADDWIDAYETQPGESAFALRVSGDSMTSPYPGDLSFPDGTIIIVDPGRASNAGDFVVAKDVSTQNATFKRLAYDGGRWFLKPLNPTYPSIEIDDPAIRVIGRVIEFRLGGKL